MKDHEVEKRTQNGALLFWPESKSARGEL